MLVSTMLFGYFLEIIQRHKNFHRRCPARDVTVYLLAKVYSNISMRQKYSSS